jgi:hypothetical protein
VTSESGDASPTGRVWREMVKDLLAAEYDRRKRMEDRGAAIVTSSASLLTLIVGLAAFVTGQGFALTSRLAVAAVFGAMIAFVVSAVFGIAVRTYGLPYTTVDRDNLNQLTSNEFWTMSADEALREDVAQQAGTIRSLRAATERKDKWVTASLASQVVAIALLIAAIGFELLARVSLAADDWDGYFDLFPYPFPI